MTKNSEAFVIENWKVYVKNQEEMIKSLLATEKNDDFDQAFTLTADLIERRARELETIKNPAVITTTFINKVGKKRVVKSNDPLRRIAEERFKILDAAIPRIEKLFQ